MLETFEVHDTTPLEGGAYEWVVASAHLAVAPDLTANARIADLAAAPRDDDGLVRFDADVRLLRPTAARNGRVLVVVPNRGMTGGVPFSLDADPMRAALGIPDPGDAFLLDRGWTIAWCGWQWDVNREQGYLGVTAPLADVEPGWMRVEFRLDATQADHSLSDSSPFFQFTDYPTVDPDDPDAVLTVRQVPIGETVVIPRSDWRFRDETHIEVDGGFQPFLWYELVYRSAYAPVAGVGLLAMRDVGAHLRRDARPRSRVRHLAVRPVPASVPLRRPQRRRAWPAGLRRCLRPHRECTGAASSTNATHSRHSRTHSPPHTDRRTTPPACWRPNAPSAGSRSCSSPTARGSTGAATVPSSTRTPRRERISRTIPTRARTSSPGPTTSARNGIKEFMPTANPSHVLDAATVMRALFVRLERWACDGEPPPPVACRVAVTAQRSSATRC